MSINKPIRVWVGDSGSFCEVDPNRTMIHAGGTVIVLQSMDEAAELCDALVIMLEAHGYTR